MKQRRRSSAFGAALAGLALHAPLVADAQTVLDDVPADYILYISRFVDNGQTLTVETTNLSPGTDTVLHLWDAQAQNEAAFNDDGGIGLASKLTWTNTGPSRWMTIFLRAYSAATKGTAQLLIDGTQWGSDVLVGGTRRAVKCGASYTYEMSLQPNGAEHTIMLGLSNSGRMVDWNRGGGVATASRISSRADVCQIVAGAYIPGPVRVLVNDDDDEDGDGLGLALETALQTCDRGAQAGCDGIHNYRDTDRDGLPDGIEVFGIDHAWAPQLLPKWGADPRHKDVFIEVDYSMDFSDQPFQGVDTVDVQDYFDLGSAVSLQNPDGQDGVRLHFDIGTVPADPTQATLFGDWGGSNAVPVNIDYTIAPEAQRHAIRQGVFRYALVTPGDGGGQAFRPGDRLGVGVSMSNRHPRSFAHELGHSVNVAHWGHNNWGAANCKPNYPSLMNYVSTDAFSQGKLSMTINPRAIFELNGIGAGQAPSHLSANPFRFPVSNDSVDFNRDGVFAADWVRAGATWATWASCKARSRVTQDLFDAPLYGSTPVLIRRRDRLFAFWIDADQRIRYRSATHAGPSSTGSCTGGDGIDQHCMAWDAVRQVPTLQNARGLSAVTWNDDEVIVAYRSAANTIRHFRATTVIGDALAGWTPEVAVAGAVTTSEPELEVIENLVGRQRVPSLGLYWRQWPVGHYYAAFAHSPGAGFSPAEPLVHARTLQPIRGLVSPTLASRRTSAGRETCAALTAPSGQLRFYCRSAVNGRWTDLSTTMFPNGQQQYTVVKPGLSFHIHRRWQGAPIFGDVGRGQWNLALTKPLSFPDMYVSATLNGAQSTATAGAFNYLGKVGDQWTGLLTGSGVALFEDPEISALKGLWITTNHYTRVQFLPFADGTFDADLRDGDDFTIMERGICLGLQDEAHCGEPSTTVSGL